LTICKNTDNRHVLYLRQKTSDFLIALATYIERFLAQLFAIEKETQASQQQNATKKTQSLYLEKNLS
ncbi:MAG: hypothetical protein LRY43_02510, partial [Gammaproteobacteria bacterium]|nr:hypothetical protein [Gammaproteobacteria bacterium]